MQRLILFDIDGTILSTHGAHLQALHRALVEVYGTAASITARDFSGWTDPQIARALLDSVGIPGAVIERYWERLWTTYLRELAAELSRSGYRTTLFQGVVPLLDALAAEDRVWLLGLLTGNIEPSARMKLESVGLWERFRLGVYGSDSDCRDALPTMAVDRARSLTGIEFRGHQVVIVGDTPHDIACGKSLGAMTVGVATGRYDPAALSKAGADAVFGDLSDTASILGVLTPEG